MGAYFLMLSDDRKSYSYMHYVLLLLPSPKNWCAATDLAFFPFPTETQTGNNVFVKNLLCLKPVHSFLLSHPY